MRYHISFFCLILVLSSCGFNAVKTSYSDDVKISSLLSFETQYVVAHKNMNSKEFLDSKNIIKQFMLN
ncbi:MAG: hypothetical protein ACO2XZ_01400 [Rickettsiales bacterium]